LPTKSEQGPHIVSQAIPQGMATEEMLANIPEDFMGEELKTTVLAKLAAVQAINVSVLDTERYIIAVENLESTLSSRLDDTYNKEVAAHEKAILNKGEIFAESMAGQRMLATAKFRQIMELIDRQKIEDKELKT
jgi:hypothetical protein